MVGNYSPEMYIRWIWWGFLVLTCISDRYGEGIMFPDMYIR